MDDMHMRVWERVLAAPEQPCPAGKAMLLESARLTADLAALEKTAGEKTRPLLKRLHRQELDILNTLKGISRMQGEGQPLGPVALIREPAARLLEKSYRRCLGNYREYMACSTCGEFAPVFSRLAQLAQEQCLGIAQVLGML